MSGTAWTALYSSVFVGIDTSIRVSYAEAEIGASSGASNRSVGRDDGLGG